MPLSVVQQSHRMTKYVIWSKLDTATDGGRMMQNAQKVKQTNVGEWQTGLWFERFMKSGALLIWNINNIAVIRPFVLCTLYAQCNNNNNEMAPNGSATRITYTWKHRYSSRTCATQIQINNCDLMFGARLTSFGDTKCNVTGIIIVIEWIPIKQMHNHRWKSNVLLAGMVLLTDYRLYAIASPRWLAPGVVRNGESRSWRNLKIEKLDFRRNEFERQAANWMFLCRSCIHHISHERFLTNCDQIKMLENLRTENCASLVPLPVPVCRHRHLINHILN